MTEDSGQKEEYTQVFGYLFYENGSHHSGIGNAAGYAAIENAANYNALMILGRATGGTPTEL